VASESDSNRRIFVAALRDFSEACEFPLLQEGCPYAVATEMATDGKTVLRRGCGEECQDILRSEYRKDAQSGNVGDGLGIKRIKNPRPRHASLGALPSFDARAHYLSQSERLRKPLWSLGALLFGLKELSTTAPWRYTTGSEARLSELREIVGLVESRGLQLDQHISRSLRFAVVPSLSVALMRSSAGSEGVGDWRKMLGIADDSRKISEDGAVPKYFYPLYAWSLSAPLWEVLAWQCPSSEAAFQLRLESVVEKGEAASDSARSPHLLGSWVWERFTQTYLEDWSQASLCAEWEYIHRNLEPPCVASEMKVREVGRDDLAQVMAQRLSKNEGRPTPARSNVYPSVVVREFTHQLVSPAAKAIEEGRRSEAANLFRTVLAVDSTDSDAHNNLAFCLLPDDPRKSLQHLDKSDEYSGKRTAVSTVNRMLALAVLGQRAAVLNLAKDYFDLDMPESPAKIYPVTTDESFVSYLWNVDSVLSRAEPSLDRVADIRSYAEYVLSRVIHDNEIAR